MPKRFVLILVALVLFVGFPRFAEIYTEWLWFGEVGFQAVFLKSLVTKGVLGIAVFAAAFALLFANLRLAVRGPERSYMVFPGGGDIEPIILERKHLGFLVAGLATVVALFVAAIAASQWFVVLQFLNSVPFGDADPIFGRDTAFYVFTLPFLDFVRYIGLAVVVLAFIGSAAAYVVTGQLALTPEGLQVGTSPRQHLAMLIAIVFVLLAAGAYLDMPRTLMTPAGILHGASYVDDVIRLPSLYILTIVAAGGALAAAYAAMSSTVWPVGAAVAAYLVVRALHRPQHRGNASSLRPG
jgi:uncharacterized membrane protein (UPF0182 family)